MVTSWNIPWFFLAHRTCECLSMTAWRPWTLHAPGPWQLYPGGPGNHDMHWYAGDFATALYDISFFVFSFPGLRHRTGDYPIYIYIHSICLKSILVASVCKGFWVIAWPLHTQCIAGQRFVSQMDSAWVFRFPSDLHLGHIHGVWGGGMGRVSTVFFLGFPQC